MIAIALLGGVSQEGQEKEPPGWITIAREWQTLHIAIRYHNKTTSKMA